VRSSVRRLRERARRAHDEVESILERPDRLVDMGVRIHVVRQDPDGEELVPGKPRLKILRTHDRGAIVDTETGTFAGRSQSPVEWFVSEATEHLVLHGEGSPLNLCVLAAMGFGKTTLLAQWMALRGIEATGIADAEIGVTAPVYDGLSFIRDAVFDLWPKAWYSWKERDKILTLANGVRFRFVSTRKRPNGESAISKFNWIAAANDEIQDSIDEDGNIEARGRDAPATRYKSWSGGYKRLATGTIKDYPQFRTWLDGIKTAANDQTQERIWAVHRGRGMDSPFNPPSWWARLRATMTALEYRRKVEAEDLPSEKRVYYAWDREHNLWPIPIKARDVTAQELARFGYQNAQLLVGHDPGRLFKVSVLLKAYQVPGQRDPVWYAVGEVTTEQSTTEHHCRQLRDALQEFGLTAQSVIVKADPYTKNHRDEEQPHRSVYTIFERHGFRITPAAYAPGSTEAAQVPVEGRLDLVNTLLCSADGVRRLYVACDDTRKPWAPKLVEAFEELERDAAHRAERDKKNRYDLTHWACCVGYALWFIEKPRIEDLRAA
jgi:hypothetical protein